MRPKSCPFPGDVFARGPLLGMGAWSTPQQRCSQRQSGEKAVWGKFIPPIGCLSPGKSVLLRGPHGFGGQRNRSAWGWALSERNQGRNQELTDDAFSDGLETILPVL